MVDDRYSTTPELDLVHDEDERARLEAENGVRQFNTALQFIRSHIKDAERPFRPRQSLLLQLHQEALAGIHRLAGTYRNTRVRIAGSSHTPPDSYLVPDEIQSMCDYVNEHWLQASAISLSAYCCPARRLFRNRFPWTSALTMPLWRPAMRRGKPSRFRICRLWNIC